MIRLRMAGGLLSTEWVPLREDKKGNLHAVIERTLWRHPAVFDQDITVDIDMEEHHARNGGNLSPTHRPATPGDES